jgi:hypothetical protein
MCGVFPLFLESLCHNQQNDNLLEQLKEKNHKKMLMLFLWYCRVFINEVSYSVVSEIKTRRITDLWTNGMHYLWIYLRP